MKWDLVWTPTNLQRLFVGDLFTTGQPGGLLLTLIIGILAIILATILGAMIGIMRASPRKAISIPAFLYIQLLRNVPLLILIFWAYFIPPYLGYETSKFLSVTVALTLFTSAYLAEFLRGGILAVPRTNVEAARALGLTPMQVQLWVVLPQAFYSMIPGITGRYIVTIKNTSLAFLIGLSELTDIGRQINTRLMTSPIEVYATLMVIYFVVNRGLSSFMRTLESRSRFNRLFLRL